MTKKTPLDFVTMYHGQVWLNDVETIGWINLRQNIWMRDHKTFVAAPTCVRYGMLWLPPGIDITEAPRSAMIEWPDPVGKFAALCYRQESGSRLVRFLDAYAVALNSMQKRPESHFPPAVPPDPFDQFDPTKLVPVLPVAPQEPVDELGIIKEWLQDTGAKGWDGASELRVDSEGKIKLWG